VSYSLGIDVGNTYVAVALAKATTVEMFNFGDPAVVTPATVHLRGDDTLAIGEAVGSPGASSPDRIGREFMGWLGNPTPMVLGGEPYTVTNLLGILLHDVVQEVTGAQGEPPDHIVLTHPASWGPFRRLLFEDAARQAGLHKPSIVTEAEAAATHYSASQQWNDGDTLAVYDLGGDTFNATVLLKQSGGIHILGEPERIEHLGGSAFDEAIFSYVDNTIDGALSKLDTTRSQNVAALAGVRQRCIRAKDALSEDTETTFQVLLPSRRFDVRLARSDFENMVRGTIELTINALSRTLQSAQVEPADLSAVLLVGGSSHIPLVAQMVSAKLGCSAIMDPHPQHVVALGAAALAAHAARADRSEHDESPRDGRQNDKRKHLAGNGATTSTLTAKKVVGAAEQRNTQPRIPAQRTAGMIPAQRTPPRKTPAAAAPPAIGNSKATDVRTVPIAAPLVKPRPVQPLRPVATPPPKLRHLVRKGERPLRQTLTNPAAKPRILIGSGLAVTLIGSILLAIFGGKSDTQALTSSALVPPPGPATTAVADLVPEVAIPAVAATIPLEANPTFVDISPDGKHAYIANANIQTITVVDTADKRVIATIPIAAGPPRFLALAPNGRALYVSIYNDQRTIHSIDVLDTGSNTVVATIPQPARPFLPAVTPDGKRLFVPNHDVASVSVVDTATNTVTGQIMVPPNPHWVAFSPDGSRAYTANHESNLVSVIDTKSLGVLTTIPVGTSPHSVAVNPRRPLVANVNFDSASVSVIDTTTQKVVATIPVGQNPQDITWAPDGRFAYAVNQGSNSVSVIDATTNRVTTTIPTGSGPTSIALLANSRQAYVSNLDGKTLTVLDLAR
jgi:YVTN family beta-propeller protein